jgi:LmbE family N-acetylglucosaminyl deacetylase
MTQAHGDDGPITDSGTPVTQRRPALAIISPHLADAVLSCFSALRAGPALVINVCTGAPAAGTLGDWDRASGATDSAARMRERVAEDEAVLRSVGAAPNNLGLVEAQYRSAALDAIAVGAALEAAIPEGVAVLAPAGIGGHADHVGVREAALAVGQRRGCPVYLYADFPYALWSGGAGATNAGTAADPGDLRLPRRLGRAFEGAPAVVTLGPADCRRKLELAQGYRSQLIGAGTDLLDWLRPPGRAWEAFWPRTASSAIGARARDGHMAAGVPTNAPSARRTTALGWR